MESEDKAREVEEGLRNLQLPNDYYIERDHSLASKGLDLKKRKQNIRHRDWILGFSLVYLSVWGFILAKVIFRAFDIQEAMISSENLLIDGWVFKAIITGIVVQFIFILRLITKAVWSIEGGVGKSNRRVGRFT